MCHIGPQAGGWAGDPRTLREQLAITICRTTRSGNVWAKTLTCAHRTSSNSPGYRNPRWPVKPPLASWSALLLAPGHRSASGSPTPPDVRSSNNRLHCVRQPRSLATIGGVAVRAWGEPACDAGLAARLLRSMDFGAGLCTLQNRLPTAWRPRVARLPDGSRKQTWQRRPARGSLAGQLSNT